MKVVKGDKVAQWKLRQGLVNAGDGKWTLIQALIPIGLKAVELKAVEEELQAEVKTIVGEAYSRKTHSKRRWGWNEGSVYLGDSKVSVRVPRV